LEGDNELVEKYCGISDKMDVTVDYIYNQIADAIIKMQCQLFAIINSVGEEAENIGYVVTVGDKKILYSYGINKKFRTGDIHKMWLAEIVKLLGAGYIVPVWKKNRRALNFFIIKNQFQIFDVGVKFITLKQA
jgi:hypothetical protein